MNRLSVIQHLASRSPSATYLEIGVFNGHVLFGVRARLENRELTLGP